MADDKKQKDKAAKPKAEPKKDSKPAKSAKPAKPAKGEATGAAGPAAGGRPRGPKQPPRLATFYLEKVRAALIEKFGYTSVMQAPRLEKIVINMGVGDAIQDQKLLDAAINELTQISGQKPSVRRAKKAISNFKL